MPFWHSLWRQQVGCLAEVEETSNVVASIRSIAIGIQSPQKPNIRAANDFTRDLR